MTNLPPRPDPYHDDLSEQAKVELAETFAALRAYYTQGHHLHWQAHERLYNVVMNRRYDPDDF